MNMRYQWILFDLDNTIYDFDRSSKEALQHTFEHFGIPYTSANIQMYKQINHQCWTDFENGKIDFATLRNIRFELFIKAIEVSIKPAEMGNYYLYLLSQADHMIEGAQSLLDNLRPKTKMAVVTNGLKEVKRPQLSRPAIRQYFDAVIISEEVGIAKPHQGFFEYTFDLINHPPKSEVIIIGDNLNSDIKGGNNFGITTCWFNPARKTNDSNIKPDSEIHHLEDFLEVLGIVD
jgi:YjjG family noncanonical pyrimidine nucleotidase